MKPPTETHNNKLLSLIRDDKDPYIIEEGRRENIKDYDDNYLIKINKVYDLENFLLRNIEAGRIISRKEVPPNFVKLFNKS